MQILSYYANARKRFFGSRVKKKYLNERSRDNVAYPAVYL